jgi:hypothetical protein
MLNLKQFEKREVLEKAGDPWRPRETGHVGIQPSMTRIDILIDS